MKNVELKYEKDTFEEMFVKRTGSGTNTRGIPIRLESRFLPNWEYQKIHFGDENFFIGKSLKVPTKELQTCKTLFQAENIS